MFTSAIHYKKSPISIRHCTYKTRTVKKLAQHKRSFAFEMSRDYPFTPGCVGGEMKRSTLAAIERMFWLKKKPQRSGGYFDTLHKLHMLHNTSTSWTLCVQSVLVPEVAAVKTPSWSMRNFTNEPFELSICAISEMDHSRNNLHNCAIRLCFC